MSATSFETISPLRIRLVQHSLELALRGRRRGGRVDPADGLVQELLLLRAALTHRVGASGGDRSATGGRPEYGATATGTR